MMLYQSQQCLCKHNTHEQVDQVVEHPILSDIIHSVKRNVKIMTQGEKTKLS